MKKIVLVIGFLFLVVGSGWTGTNALPTNGNIGIGTPDPGAKLDIQYPGDGAIGFRIVGDSSDGGLTIKTDTNIPTQIQGLANDHISPWDLTLNPEGGNVNIGTIESKTMLRINNRGDNFEALRINTDDDGGLFVRINDNDSATLQTFGDGDNYSNGQLMINPFGGNVGIGNGLPNYPLDVSGDIYTNSKLFVSEGVGIGTISPKAKLDIQYPGDGAIGFRIVGDSTDGGLTIKTNTNTSTQIQGLANDHISPWDLALNPEGGNVCIGTSNPGNYKLAVKGKIRAEEVVVETGWADYVFEEDYKLQPLSEIETFVKENKHLPEIPSAEKIKEDGLSVAEMMELQMKKIEELTLHLIEQNKMITRQNQQIETQNKKIALLIKYNKEKSN